MSFEIKALVSKIIGKSLKGCLQDYCFIFHMGNLIQLKYKNIKYYTIVKDSTTNKRPDIITAGNRLSFFWYFVGLFFSKLPFVISLISFVQKQNLNTTLMLTYLRYLVKHELQQ